MLSARLVNLAVADGDTARRAGATRQATADGLGQGQGQAPASDVVSLKYLIADIQLCQRLSPIGDTFIDPQGCIDLYRLESPPEADALDPAAAQQDPRYIDLLDPNQLERLTVPRPAAAAIGQAYNFGIVSWVGPVRVTAAVPLPDAATTLFTRAGAVDAATHDTVAASLVDGPAAEATLMQTLSRSWFKLQSPLLFAADGLAGEAPGPVVVNLAFDPDQLLRGASTALPSPRLRDAGNRSIVVPPLDLNPFPALAARPVRVETYIVHQTQLPGQAFDLRLSLYLRDDDAAGTILSADLRGLLVDGSASRAEAAKVIFVDTLDAPISFLNAAYQPLLAGLQRSKQVGDTSTASLPCNGALPALTAAGCTGGSVAAEVELESIRTLP